MIDHGIIRYLVLGYTVTPYKLNLSPIISDPRTRPNPPYHHVHVFSSSRPTDGDFYLSSPSLFRLRPPRHIACDHCVQKSAIMVRITSIEIGANRANRLHHPGLHSGSQPS